MHPLITLLVAITTLLCSFVSGVDAEHGAAFERVAECIYICTHADSADENLPVETVICDAHKAGYECMTRPFDSSPHSSTEILDIYRAYMLELFFLANKANMCSPPLPYMELKELVDRSGIMKKKGLTSLENDEFVPCAGEINMNCYTAGVTDWKGHSSFFRIHLDHAKCFKRETPKCDFPIQRHINAVVQEFSRHLEVYDPLHGGKRKKMKQ